MAISISKSLIDKFHDTYQNGQNHDHMYKGMRLGQAFHTHFKLDKITNEEDKIFCDRLYEMKEEKARKTIESITDYAQ